MKFSFYIDRYTSCKFYTFKLVLYVVSESHVVEPEKMVQLDAEADTKRENKEDGKV